MSLLLGHLIAAVMTQRRYNEVGEPIPTGKHSVSVCLPTWQDTVHYKRGMASTLERMQSGYPRFFMPLIVRKVCMLWWFLRHVEINRESLA